MALLVAAQRLDVTPLCDIRDVPGINRSSKISAWNRTHIRLPNIRERLRFEERRRSIRGSSEGRTSPSTQTDRPWRSDETKGVARRTVQIDRSSEKIQ